MRQTYFKNELRPSLPLTALCDAPGETAPAVQLGHTMPDGSRHIDLMIAPAAILRQPPDADARCLLTFRLPVPLWEIEGSSSMEIVRLGDHRFFYFMHEGEIPGVRGDRGRVERVAIGAVEPIAGGSVGCSEDELTADSVWTLHEVEGIRRETVRFRLERIQDHRWRLRTGV